MVSSATHGMALVRWTALFVVSLLLPGEAVATVECYQFQVSGATPISLEGSETHLAWPPTSQWLGRACTSLTDVNCTQTCDTGTTACISVKGRSASGAGIQGGCAQVNGSFGVTPSTSCLAVEIHLQGSPGLYNPACGECSPTQSGGPCIPTLTALATLPPSVSAAPTTPQPTHTPTQQPTDVPTEAPTVQPSRSPTSSTTTPTAPPTATPSRAPTPPTTPSPTQYPTPPPTSAAPTNPGDPPAVPSCTPWQFTWYWNQHGFLWAKLWVTGARVELELTGAFTSNPSPDGRIRCVLYGLPSGIVPGASSDGELLLFEVDGSNYSQGGGGVGEIPPEAMGIASNIRCSDNGAYFDVAVGTPATQSCELPYFEHQQYVIIAPVWAGASGSAGSPYAVWDADPMCALLGPGFTLARVNSISEFNFINNAYNGMYPNANLYNTGAAHVPTYDILLEPPLAATNAAGQCCGNGPPWQTLPCCQPANGCRGATCSVSTRLICKRAIPARTAGPTPPPTAPAPSARPTLPPTQVPTDAPTPSAPPTDTPTVFPTGTPTTLTPTSQSPTPSPTAAPTRTPVAAPTTLPPTPSPVHCNYAVVLGGASNLNGVTYPLSSALHEVTCCADSNVGGWDVCPGSGFGSVYGERDYGAMTCQSTRTWSQAKAYCEAQTGNGVTGRLCTVSEITQGQCGQGTGCAFDSEHVWTSTLDPNGHCIPAGSPTPVPTAPTVAPLYFVGPSPINYAGARGYCQSNGAALAILNDAASNTLAAAACGPRSCWLGLARVSGGTSAFRWGDGTTPGYTNWASGEPNNSGGNEDTAVMNLVIPAYSISTVNGRWFDLAGGNTQWVYPLCRSTATDQPTSAPSTPLTPPPTDVPSTTAPVTTAPTRPPTPTPSTATPTDAPVPHPTTTPTTAPTTAPSSISPSDAPSQLPSTVPTTAPTTTPITQPTLAPIRTPTLSPTDLPTTPPTETPTRVPTSEPTNAPTVSPTQPPSDAPTAVPVAVPTVAPTTPPTLTPTAAPIVGTASPTTPTATPTATPTPSPTTAAPSLVPTVLPTAVPSALPTRPPTDAPLAGPTVAPSSGPTELPTALPTVPPVAPTPLATQSPTGTPTVQAPAPSTSTLSPSALPTETPTLPPTATPVVPTSGPTDGAPTIPPTTPPATPTTSPTVTATPTAEQTSSTLAPVAPTITPTSPPTSSPTSAAPTSFTPTPTAPPTAPPTTSPPTTPPIDVATVESQLTVVVTTPKPLAAFSAAERTSLTEAMWSVVLTRLLSFDTTLSAESVNGAKLRESLVAGEPARRRDDAVDYVVVFDGRVVLQATLNAVAASVTLATPLVVTYTDGTGLAVTATSSSASADTPQSGSSDGSSDDGSSVFSGTLLIIVVAAAIVVVAVGGVFLCRQRRSHGGSTDRAASDVNMPGRLNIMDVTPNPVFEAPTTTASASAGGQPPPADPLLGVPHGHGWRSGGMADLHNDLDDELEI
eukprot:m.87342 g.87342  ORF g.87342 m.87342 type:complete len:1473 (+) comp19926_c0_seq1:455-4873(+)